MSIHIYALYVVYTLQPATIQYARIPVVWYYWFSLLLATTRFTPPTCMVPFLCIVVCYVHSSHKTQNRSSKIYTKGHTCVMGTVCYLTTTFLLSDLCW